MSRLRDLLGYCVAIIGWVLDRAWSDKATLKVALQRDESHSEDGCSLVQYPNGLVPTEPHV